MVCHEALNVFSRQTGPAALSAVAPVYAAAYGMNAAEQKEEKQREKEELLTAQDYFRRGFRASSEGHTRFPR